MQTGAAIIWKATNPFDYYNGPNYAVIYKQRIDDQFSLTSIPTPDIRLPIQKAINEAILSVCITIIIFNIEDFFVSYQLFR
jgi:hypothetical protein